jgi:uncharacterized protein YndB with AHSA1/START domain
MGSVREAPIPPERIFRFYADPATWPLWGHNTIGAVGEAPVTEGATVHVTAGYRRVWPVLIRRVVPDRLVLCEVRPPGVTILSTYEVTPSASGSRLRHEIEVSGRLAAAYRLLRPLYVRLLSKETRKLVELAQRPEA